ncbi:MULTISPECIES: hypothetical protein [Glycomyces]|uniref:Uncharacterized protein n=1 Tax=Glycomyces lechevalierae TaxID=256034 RepID=A0A9X3PMM5_9ACTN|nr:hypothetical protein [Glycomyces lechevalierae]MDA1387597.1 hypothetical protein [Glycomyces lechevalierae]MDR7336637.1 hypothetical protein [Glycomyces lechevalierae]
MALRANARLTGGLITLTLPRACGEQGAVSSPEADVPPVPLQPGGSTLVLVPSAVG